MRLLAVLVFLAACGDPEPDPCAFHTEADDVTPPPLSTPRWAFRPWISKDISDGPDTRAFVSGFRERDIPVGVVVVDSPWATHYNTFVVNETRYPAFPAMVDELHAQDIRVVLWTTQMVNRTGFDIETGGDKYVGPSPNFEEGKRCGFFVDHGGDVLWWKGNGAGVDFFNPDAVAWWHRQQDNLLMDAKIDGWKLDFGEEYLADTVETVAGVMDRQAYSEAYYADFYAYGASRRGIKDFVTMVRPYDRSYGFPGRFFARREHAPVGWVGDQRRDWIGLTDALDEMFRSAAAGYAVLGSDIGGYLDHDDEALAGPAIPFDTLVFARWTALGALNPWMQLHGRANVAPWTVPDHVDETVALYRYWATLHDQLVPWWYSLAQKAQRDPKGTIMRPIGELATWTGDYRYTLGDDLLVAPILDASSVRDIALPAGRWFDWWQPGAAALDGNRTLAAYAMPERDRIPLFVHEGAIIPATVGSAVTGLGTARPDALTVLAWPATAISTFELVDEDDAPTTIHASTAGIDLSRTLRPTYLRIRRDTAPTGVTIAGTAATMVADAAALDAAERGWFYDAAAHWLWVKVPRATAAIRADISP